MNNKIKNIEKKNILNKFKNIFKTTFSVLSMFFILSTTIVFADDIKSSKIFTGTQKLIDDAGNAILVLGASICAVGGAIMGIALALSDEQDKKKWKSRLGWLFVGFVVLIVIGTALKVVGSYYQ